MCASCRRRRKSVKSLAVHRFPPVLVIHLKRFQYDASSREKLGIAVDVPVSSTLDLAPYTTPGALHSGADFCTVGRDNAGVCCGGKRGLGVYGGIGGAGRRDSSLEGRGGHNSQGGAGIIEEETHWVETRRNRKYRHPTYELYGVCNHMGGLEGGHYTAHCRGRSNGVDNGSEAGGEWNTFDDARVAPVNPARVGGSAAYVLFYRLVHRPDTYR